MTEQEKNDKMKEVEEFFSEELKRIEKERDDKIKAIKKRITERHIDSLLADLKE